MTNYLLITIPWLVVLTWSAQAAYGWVETYEPWAQLYRKEAKARGIPWDGRHCSEWTDLAQECWLKHPVGRAYRVRVGILHGPGHVFFVVDHPGAHGPAGGRRYAVNSNYPWGPLEIARDRPVDRAVHPLADSHGLDLSKGTGGVSMKQTMPNYNKWRVYEVLKSGKVVRVKSTADTLLTSDVWRDHYDRTGRGY